MSAPWHIEDDGGVVRESEPSPSGGTVSLAFIRGTLRRLWYVWVCCALLGLSLAFAWLVLVPPKSVGTVTLLLAHDSATQPDAAMATDVRLLKTRTVAQEVGDKLGLEVSPDDLQATILAVPATSSVLEVDIAGSDAEDAVRRAGVLADTYLSYREEQLTLQSRAVTQGYEERIDALQSQVDDLTQQYDAITASGTDSDRAADVLTLRGQLLTEITRLQNEIESDSLEANAVTAASHVLDPASLVPQSPLRRAVLSVGSGLVGGLALGLGLVVLYAVTTGRLRSRADVAAAMGLPVAYSAGRLSPRWRRPGERHRAALELLVDGLASALPTRGKRRQRLGLISVDCEREGAKVIAALARRFAVERSVVAMDLTSRGLVEKEMASPASERADIATEAATGSAVAVSGPSSELVADVILSLASFEIGRGLAHVKSTAPRCVVLVKSGESSAERLRTVAQAARAAGLDIPFVMLVGADSSDASFGGAALSADKAPRAR